jgi:hypothetical protein
MNLEETPRNDWITVDLNLNPPGIEMINLIDPTMRPSIALRGKRAAVRVPLDGHQMALLISDTG